MPAVNPEMLSWARQEAGLTVEEAAKKLGFKDTKSKTAKEKILEIESGEKDPTKVQLYNISRIYRRPLITFYLKAPPEKGNRGQDFRTLSSESNPQDNVNVDILLRDIMARQSILKSLLEDEEVEELPFIDSMTMNDGFQAVANNIRKTILFDLKEFQRKQNKGDAFKYLRDCIEKAGIFVLLVGNLGSHHTNIPPEIFRGFAIADTLAPFIAINDQDAQAAWSFTALHELAHLWLGETGISDFSINNQLESFCNDVAGEILFPSNMLEEFDDVRTSNFEDITKVITTFANKNNISRKMVTYRLYRNKRISSDTFKKLNDQFQREWLSYKNEKSDEGGPNYYTVKAHRLGGAIIEIVRSSLAQGTITYTKAGKVLGIKNPLRVQNLLDHAASAGGA